MTKSRKGAAKAGFEANLKRLEQIVEELEKGDIELEKSLDLYEQGAKLIEACRKQIAEAETRIEKLRPASDGLEAGPLEPDE